MGRQWIIIDCILLTESKYSGYFKDVKRLTSFFSNLQDAKHVFLPKDCFWTPRSFILSLKYRVYSDSIFIPVFIFCMNGLILRIFWQQVDSSVQCIMRRIVMAILVISNRNAMSVTKLPSTEQRICSDSFNTTCWKLSFVLYVGMFIDVLFFI